MITREFGVNKKGEPAKLFVFKNQNGMEMQVSDFGATLHKLLVPDRNGKKREIEKEYHKQINNCQHNL